MLSQRENSGCGIRAGAVVLGEERHRKNTMRSHGAHAVFASVLSMHVAALCAQPSRIVTAIDDSRRVDLPGSAPFWRQPQYDRGVVAPSFPMRYLTLLMQPSTEQKASLAELLADQQDRSSPKYHRWLTPELYADSFGLNPVDMENVAAWLRAEGFIVNYQARGRNWIAFSGDAAQIQHTFHSEIHEYAIDGQKHFGSAGNQSVPSALAGIVAGIQGLDDLRPKPAYARGRSVRRAGGRPNFTDSYGNHELAPGDIAAIYDLNPLYADGFNGTGQTVVVVGETDIYGSDIDNFRSSFNLPYQPVQSPPCAIGSLCMILYGPDPGTTADLDEAEMGLELAGAVAWNASIYYVYSTNAFSSAQYAIDNDFGPVISMGSGGCEQANVASLDSGRSLAQEANLLGVTWVAASGSGGAADCDWNGSSTAPLATQGLAVDFPASVPEVTAVGGTDLNEGGGAYWSSSNGASGGSALSYVPEVSWNDTVYGTGLSSTLAAGGGGVSIYYPTPAWQTGPGFPNDGFRDVPDISMAASWDHDGYLLCILECPANYTVYGGTSAAAPVFAGILALLNQIQVDSGVQLQAGLGNINPTLYALYRSSPYAFHDVTTGSNVVPCQVGTPDCIAGSFGYYAQPGYDQATGLGSIDGFNLALAWEIVPAVPQLSITKSHSGDFTQGQGGAAYTVTVTNEGPGPTTGPVSVTDTIPAGLTLVSMSSSGSNSAPTWSCAGSTCTTSGVLGSGASYPPIVVTVNVALSAPVQVTNQVSVTGGGSGAAGASDVTAILTFASYTLTVNELGQGTVTSADGSIDCADGSGACSASYPGGSTVTLSATAAASWTFSMWSGAASSYCSGANACNLVMNQNLSPTATFTPTVMASPSPGITLSGSLADFSWNAVSGATEYQLTVGTTAGGTNVFSGTTGGLSQMVGSIPCADTVGGPIYVQLAAEVNGGLQSAADYTYTCKLGLGNFNGNGYQDLVWMNNSTQQVTVHYYDGAPDINFIGWNWLNIGGEPNGWVLVGAADFDGNGVPDLVWEYMPTGQVTVNYYGGPGGTTLLGWNWLNETGDPGWTVVAVADMNGDGVPDLIWQNNTTNQVTVNYYGGAGGATLTAWNWLNIGGEPAGWHVVAAADFDGNGTPDLVWQYAPTRQVSVNYYGGTGGATYQGWSWLNAAGVPGWTVVGANDFNGDGVPDLVWQNDATAQVTVNYYGGAGGTTLIGWNWLTNVGYPGWTAVVPR
jgi:uncharacterized repeat protein (TIGR01451 family)